MRTYRFDTGSLAGDPGRELFRSFKAGDTVLISGPVYTARDAAHKRLISLIEQGGSPPFPIKDAVLYYTGPTPAPPGRIIGACGPTTSARMDRFTPKLLALGLAGMIGKGGRSAETDRAIALHRAVYFCAAGGAGALAEKSVLALEEIAFPELGCESVKKIILKDFPVIVGTDSGGNSVFDRKNR